jgi:GTP-binding protein
MIFGEHNRGNDITANPCKEKKLTNIRAAGRDENVILSPVKPMTLERALHFIREDEMVEVTPRSIRLRKTWLTENDRRRAEKKRSA